MSDWVPSGYSSIDEWKRTHVAVGLLGVKLSETDPGMRKATLAFYRSGTRDAQSASSKPIECKVWPGQQRMVIVDGRHRALHARQEGKRGIRAHIVGMGPRGGQVWSYTGTIPV